MTRVAVVTGASHGLGATFAATGGEAVRFALRLPPEARVEEIVLRSAEQAPEY